MNKAVFIVISILISNVIFSQSAKDLHSEAIKYIKLNNYKMADSLLTMSLKTYPTANTYFDCAIVNLLMNDTCAYCYHLDAARTIFNDKQASDFYFRDCAVIIDTIYYSRSFKIKDNSKFRYYSLTFIDKCLKNTHGEFHDNRKTYSLLLIPGMNNSNFINAQNIKTSIIASFYIDDTLEIFTYINSTFLKQNAEMFFKGDHKKVKLNFLKEYLLKTYPDLVKIPKNKPVITLELIIEKNNTLKNCYLFPNIESKDTLFKDLNADLLKFMKANYTFNTSVFHNKSVSYRGIFVILFE